MKPWQSVWQRSSMDAMKYSPGQKVRFQWEDRELVGVVDKPHPTGWLFIKDVDLGHEWRSTLAVRASKVKEVVE